jgi:tetratricopeptide (TPR) repeat protein
MTKRILVDAIESTDTETKTWKSRFAAAKAAYDAADFKQCETLLALALEQGKGLKERTFAINTCLVGQGALYLATGKPDEAAKQLNQAIRELSGAGEPALKELYAVALRFHAQFLEDKGDLDGAEDDLQQALKVLQTLGVDGAVQLAYTMSDLATVYIGQGDLKEAGELVFSSMEVLEATLGHENPEYVRADVIYSLCHAANEEEFLGGVEDSILRMQYQVGRQHPSIVRAVRWYLQKLQELGDQGRIAEVEQRFGVHAKNLSAVG